jgi:metal transporter CNNM
MITDHVVGSKESELDEGEADIIRGALSLSGKRVRDITTKIKYVYSLTPDTLLDDAKIDEMKLQNRSRIPVFNEDYTRCDGVLLMKNLVDIDFDSRPVFVSELKLYQVKSIGSMTALDTVFHKFIAAHSHMMTVTEDHKIVGIVTIEDLIEEILDREIIDEADSERVG